jgi:hypothetical protein
MKLTCYISLKIEIYAMVSYYFCILIAESVWRNQETRNDTDNVIQECLSKWFKDRNGGGSRGY